MLNRAQAKKRRRLSASVARISRLPSRFSAVGQVPYGFDGEFSISRRTWLANPPADPTPRPVASSAFDCRVHGRLVEEKVRGVQVIQSGMHAVYCPVF